MADFFAELKRRHIYRVGAAYVVVAWALTQVVDVLSQVFELPGWIAQPAVVLLVIGFPVAPIAAWMIESKPHEAVASAVRSKSTTVDWLLFGAVAVLIALTAYQRIAPSVASGGPLATGAISLAVLPFANVSGDPEQEFFSDGITDEIIAALAKVPSLQLVARTSAFRFKGERNDMRAIGQALNASHLIDGSVRRAGNRVRITAQLVRADNGVGVWTESYDRELTDVFAIQEDIAEAIAGALRVPLGLTEGQRLVSNRSIDPDSYQQYLRAKALMRVPGLTEREQAAALLEQVVMQHSDYAPAWAALGLAYASTPNFHPAWVEGKVEEARRVVASALSKGEAAIQRSIQLDANNADGYGALAYLHEVRGELLMAEDSYLKALAFDPNDPDFLNLYAQLLAKVGRLKESLATRERLQTLEPFVPNFNNNTAGILWLNGQTDGAIAMLRAGPPGIRAFDLARIYASAGRYVEAADALLELPAGGDAPGAPEEAVRLLRMGPNAASSALSSLRLGRLGLVHVYLGDPVRVLEFYEDAAEAGYFSSSAPSRVWHTTYAPARKTERFKALVRRMGLVDYWRARGWPDLCRPVGADDFECE
jgi:TolB-like protein/Flp pilus assembly protein TadD